MNKLIRQHTEFESTCNKGIDSLRAEMDLASEIPSAIAKDKLDAQLLRVLYVSSRLFRRHGIIPSALFVFLG